MTGYLDDWLTRVKEMRTAFGGRLFSIAEFEDRLSKLVKAAGSPFLAVAVEMNPGGQRALKSIGAAGAGDDTARITLPLGETTTALIRAWSDADQASSTDSGMGAIRGLVESWWRAPDRDGLTGLLRWGQAGVPQALGSTVSEWSNERHCPIAFGDVDRFKNLNDTLGQAEGDLAIALVAGFVADLAPSDAVVLGRGGDEFLLALPPRPVRELIEELTALRAAVECRLRDSYPDLPGEPLGFSIGVAMFSGADVVAQGLGDRAERTLKPDGVKQRSRVSFETAPDFIPLDNEAARVSVEATRARLGEPESSDNVWLRWLSGSVAENGGQVDTELVAGLVETINPIWGPVALGQSLGTDADHFDGSRELSALDVALALAHGYTRGLAGPDFEPTVTLTYGSDGGYAQLLIGDSIVFEQGDPGDEPHIVRFPTMSGEPSAIDARRMIALKIGEDEGFLLPQLYADQIYLDDRPTRGGGLPDFWEAALAQVIDSLHRHPNVTDIVVHGHPTHGTETMRWLTEAWSDDDLTYLSAKLGRSTQELASIRERLTGAVTLVADRPAELIVARTAHERGLPLAETPIVATPVSHPRLHRELVGRRFLLDKQDGCRVQTASVAYPLALDIVRQTDPGIYDSLRRPFSELVDFRIQLTQPTEDPIPRYYLRDENSLNAYFNREFASPGGKFFDALAANSQYEHVIAHLCECIASDAYASRRAVLVVPHTPASANVSPLGLVSVRGIPRLEADGTVRLDYSFTWRTVEAIVGLPYSLFGSIRFAEQITERVIAGIGANGKKSVAIGQLSYIAHSLHMYNDGYGANVARRIVNDESS